LQPKDRAQLPLASYFLDDDRILESLSRFNQRDHSKKRLPSLQSLELGQSKPLSPPRISQPMSSATFDFAAGMHSTLRILSAVQRSDVGAASSVLDEPTPFIPADRLDSVSSLSAPDEGFRLMNSFQNTDDRNLIAEQTISPALFAHSTQLRPWNDVAQLGVSDAVPITSLSRIELVDTRFVNDEQVLNHLGQGPNDALTNFIYQADLFSGQNDQRLESQIGEIEPSDNLQLANLRNELQIALQSNEDLGRQIKEGEERENALRDQLYGPIAQNTYQQTVIRHGGRSVPEGQHGEECLRMELQKTRREMMDVQRRLAEREAELEELRCENELAMKIQREVGAPVIVQKADPHGILSQGLLNLLRPCLLEQIKTVKKKFSKSSPKSRIFKIECIMNEVLLDQFEGAKQRLNFLGRPSEEEILFHGTSLCNVNGCFTTSRNCVL
jgi:hypothetical protein